MPTVLYVRMSITISLYRSLRLSVSIRICLWLCVYVTFFSISRFLPAFVLFRHYYPRSSLHGLQVGWTAYDHQVSLQAQSHSRDIRTGVSTSHPEDTVRGPEASSWKRERRHQTGNAAQVTQSPHTQQKPCVNRVRNRGVFLLYNGYVSVRCPGPYLRRDQVCMYW